jgi:hypothetical protein
VSSAGEINERFGERRGGRVVGVKKKRAIQRVARWATCQQEKEIHDSASGAAGVLSAGERNERFSKRHGGRVVGGRKIRAMQRAALRACCRREKEKSDSASGAADVSSARERNEGFSKWRGGQGVVKRNERVMQRAALRARRRKERETRGAASGAAGEASKCERNERFSERRGGRVVGVRKELAIQRAARRAGRRWEKETSDSASGTAGVSSAGDRNERFSERRGA